MFSPRERDVASREGVTPADSRHRRVNVRRKLRLNPDTVRLMALPHARAVPGEHYLADDNAGDDSSQLVASWECHANGTRLTYYACEYTMQPCTDRCCFVTFVRSVDGPRACEGGEIGENLHANT
jgi:hypothetical protein